MKKRDTLKVLGAAAATVMTTPSSSAKAADATANTIIELDRQLNKHIVEHNVQAAAALYDDDFILTVSGGGFKRKADMLADIGNPALTLTVCETVDIAVRIRGGTAVLTGVLHQVGRLGERNIDMKLRVTDTWVRGEKDRWLLLAGHASVMK